jgi:prolyl oligopeptidase
VATDDAPQDARLDEERAGGQARRRHGVAVCHGSWLELSPLSLIIRGMSRIIAAALLLSMAGAARADGPPPTPRRPVPGPVVDDYRWLENDDDPEVQKWTEEQNRYARSVLDNLPSTKDIRARVTELVGAPYVDYRGLERSGKRLFGLKVQPPRDQPVLVALASADQPGSEQVLLDPNVLDPSGHTAIDFFVPSRDGSRVAVSLSENGSESGTVHVYDAATGKELGDVIPRVNGGTAGGSLAWNRDGSGFFYTRYPAPGERPPADLPFYQQVWFHKLGHAADSYSIGKDFPRIAEVKLDSAPDGRHVVARVANGDGGEYAIYLADAQGRWTRVADYADRVVAASLGYDDALYCLSLKDAPHGKVLRVPLARPTLAAAKVIVPEGKPVVQRIEPAPHRLYVTMLVGGPNELHVYDLAGKKLAVVPLAPVSSVDDVVIDGGDDALIRTESYVEPPAWIAYRGGKTVRTALAVRSPVDLSGFEVVRDEAISKDGTHVPMSIVRPKQLAPSGDNLTVLFGYGGYGSSESPYFSRSAAVLLEQGGVYVWANLRGGGELGEEWHRGGNLTKKQNVFDDFAACAQRLIELKITSPKRLAIVGGSNGGLLMGATLTQHPDLVGAVVSHVGIYDMLRVELGPNGAFNVTEFGTVEDPEQRKALEAYSPYHHVKDGTVYPPVLLTTGQHDPRVQPWQSRKMAARLQAASPQSQTLLRVNVRGGHGIGASLKDIIDLQADQWAFIFAHLGVPYRAMR